MLRHCAMIVGLVGITLANASQVQADSFSIWMTGNGQTATSFDFSNNGVNLHVTGGSYDYGNNWNDAYYLGKWQYGIGIKNSPGDDKHTVDGSGYKDVLNLVFNTTVKLTKIYFGYVSGGQDYVQILNGDHSASFGTFALQGGGSVQYVDLTGYNITGDAFGLKAPGTYDSWKVKGVHGCEVPTTVVPTPTAAMAGLIGMGMLAIRRRRAA